MWRFVAACSLALAAIGLAAPPGAQARLLESFPADGASVEDVDEVSFEFEQLLLEDDAQITLTRTNGDSISVEEVTVDETVLRGRVVGEVPSGTYELGYSVRSADGATNEGTLRISVDSPSQALSGGLLAVIGIFVALFAVLTFVFQSDRRRRGRHRNRSSGV